MKQTSTKGAYIKRQYAKVCEEMDNTYEPICTGCGTGFNLSHSHIISRNQCKGIGISELIYDINNITYHCLGENGCHTKWETKSKRGNLLDYNANIEYIRTVDEGLYNRMKT